MESKYQVTYNKSRCRWFANISYFEPQENTANTNRYRTYKTKNYVQFESLIQAVNEKLLDLEKKNS